MPAPPPAPGPAQKSDQILSSHALLNPPVPGGTSLGENPGAEGSAPVAHAVYSPWSQVEVEKVWGEALGRVYSDDHEVSIICVRIARVVAEDRPMEPADYSRWGSKRDLSDMIQKCIEVSSDVRFDVFNFTSNNKWGYLDLEHAKEVLGWTPQDSADPYL